MGKGEAKAEDMSFALSGKEMGTGGVMELVDWSSRGGRGCGIDDRWSRGAGVGEGIARWCE